MLGRVSPGPKHRAHGSSAAPLEATDSHRTAGVFPVPPFSSRIDSCQRRRRMAGAAQVSASRHNAISPHGPRGTVGMALAALGIVYGDIGTSPLYALKQAASAAGTLVPETIMGIGSLIFWALILIVSLKYALLVLRADNQGEGGIVALLALLDVRHAPPRSWRASLLVVGLIGAALLYGDGVITPAISVLSAVEGLKVDAPQLAPVVVPISVAILVCLFLVQRKGTAFIGNIFGPVMLIWFIAIGLVGLLGLI